MKVDLHIHTCISDGLLTKPEIISLAQQQQVMVISFTDHNCYTDNNPLRKEAGEKGVRIIDGIEFSAEFHRKEVHICAYGLKGLSNQLEEFCGKYAELKTEQTKRRCEESTKHPLLTPHGEEIYISFDELCDFKKEGIFFWNEIGYLLSDKYNQMGYLPRMDYNDANNLLNGDLKTGERFQHSFRNLEKGKILWHSPKRSFYIDAERLIHLIKDAEGLSCLVHPGEQNLEESTIREMRRFGLDALEVYTPKNKGRFPYYRKISEDLGLYISGGTDFHYFDDKHRLGMVLMGSNHNQRPDENDFFPITIGKIDILDKLL